MAEPSPELQQILSRVMQQQAGSQQSPTGTGDVQVTLYPQENKISTAPSRERKYDDGQGGNVVHVYSTTGKDQSKAAFDQAIAEYDRTGEAPKGFVVLQPGMMQKVRSGFEAVRKPVTEGARSVDQTVGNTMLALTPPSLRGGMQQVPPDSQGLLEMMTPQTPAQAGMAAGTIAAAPFMGPVTATTAMGRAGGPLVARMLANAGIMGGSAATGSSLGKLAGGESLSFKDDVVIPFTFAAGAEGFGGVVKHFMSKYLSPDMGNKIATEMLDTIKKQYPDIANDPAILERFASSSQNLTKLTQVMSRGLRGDLETLVSSTVKDINQVLPSSLSKGTQNTVRAQVRAIVNAGNEMLDNLGDGQVMSTAQQKMVNAASNIATVVQGQFTGQSILQQTLQRVDQVLMSKVGNISKFQEGAQVLAALRNSGAESGFNPTNFVNTIRGNYQQNPSSLLDRMGQIAGQGTRLTDATMQSPGRSVAGGAWNLIKDYLLPGGMSRLLPNAPANRAPTALLPWQMSRGRVTPGSATATISATNAAIKSFLGDEQ